MYLVPRAMSYLPNIVHLILVAGVESSPRGAEFRSEPSGVQLQKLEKHGVVGLIQNDD